jgi:hypothetical protein
MREIDPIDYAAKLRSRDTRRAACMQARHGHRELHADYMQPSFHMQTMSFTFIRASTTGRVTRYRSTCTQSTALFAGFSSVDKMESSSNHISRYIQRIFITRAMQYRNIETSFVLLSLHLIFLY